MQGVKCISHARNKSAASAHTFEMEETARLLYNYHTKQIKMNYLNSLTFMFSFIRRGSCWAVWCWLLLSSFLHFYNCHS